jgi:pimeloyl-ACP methyl ester carboxylesterase
MWKAVTADLAEYHCIAVDLPGHGGSADQPWVSIDDAANKVEEVIKDIPETTDIYVIGASLGGYVALQMMRAAPDRFKGAALSGIHAGGQPTSGIKRAASRLLVPFMKWSFFAKRNAASMGITDKAGFAAEAKKADQASILSAADEVLEYTAPSDLDLIETPTLVVAGAKDQPMVLAALGTYRDANPVFKVATVDDFGPAWSTQAPALFANMVRAVVGETDLPDGILDRDMVKLLEVLPEPEAASEETQPEEISEPEATPMEDTFVVDEADVAETNDETSEAPETIEPETPVEETSETETDTVAEPEKKAAA